ncbi:winged helix-turn-helix transcriptional regulator [Mesorhizobium sp. ASY16-5R]|uniref:winged helix-turn-helix transcriptional regulator n=1 Tax=Mesorhizobium sp. ASY16-5R TaxID=3445772 RepID=UPI003FA18C0A
MEDHGGYGQFCPVSMAAEVLCTRWTMLVVRELLYGSKRFNDLRRGVPRMSPALLSKRLKDLEKCGIIVAVPGDRSGMEYRLSAAGEELRPVVLSMGLWGHRWVESRLTLKNLDPSLLMWDIRRKLNPEPLPPGRCTIQFQYPELPDTQKNWWLVIDAGTVDLCNFDPGYDLNLLVRSSLYTMTAIWMGIVPIPSEIAAGRLVLEGERPVAKAMQQWMGFSPFVGEQRAVA